VEKSRYRLINGSFPDDWNIKTDLNCITLLAVFEHIPAEKQIPVIRKIYDLLMPGGLVILTVPSKRADHLLNLLHGMGLILVCRSKNILVLTLRYHRYFQSTDLNWKNRNFNSV
jgi:2-polyprenyl-3-methyl-5-hydroxy-6-metoxy-1,4-benzoquinol methylase